MIARRRLLGAVSLLPAAALLPGAVLAAPAGSAFAPGTTPLRLVRRVERELRDGARLVVERAWSIRFLQQGQGFRLEGKQTDVSVDAPATLAFLADMERGRVEEDRFPLQIADNGEIMGQASASSDATLARAIEAVRERLARQFDQPDDRAAAEQFLTQLQRAGEQTLAGWPAMLFAPGNLDRSEERAVPLPGGRTGAVTVRTLAASDPETGLMQRFERRVDTRLGTSARSGLERFTLVAAG